MSRKKASITALALTAGALIYLYKPSDNELVVESPTQFVTPDSPAEQSFIRAHIQPPRPIIVEAKSPEVVTAVAKPAVKTAVKVKKPETVTVEATFYTSSCSGCSGITKMGDNVKRTIYVNGLRVIAADPKLIPLGSIVNVKLEDGTSFKASVRDVGGGIKGNRIDVLVANKKEAYRLGRQKAVITIIERGGK